MSSLPNSTICFFFCTDRWFDSKWSDEINSARTKSSFWHVFEIVSVFRPLIFLKSLFIDSRSSSDSWPVKMLFRCVQNANFFFQCLNYFTHKYDWIYLLRLHDKFKLYEESLAYNYTGRKNLNNNYRRRKNLLNLTWVTQQSD